MGAANSTAKTSHHQHAVVHRGHGHRAKTYEEDRRDSGGPRTLTQPFIPVLTKALLQRSAQFGAHKQVHLNAFVDLVFADKEDLGRRMFQYLVRSVNDQLDPKEKPRITLPEKEFVAILDAKFQEACGPDNLALLLTLFTDQKGVPVMTQGCFRNFLLNCYEAASGKARDDSDETKFIVDAFVTSAFHQKQEVNVGYLQGWIRKNCPHIMEPLGKYLVNRLSTAHESSGDSERKIQLIHDFPIISKGCASNEPPPPDERETEKIIHPAVVWAILVAFPESYGRPDKGTSPNKGYFQSLTEIPIGDADAYAQALDQLSNMWVPRKWSVLYDTEDHGMAMNRFIHHVMKYRGPTIMVIYAGYGYRFCLGVDEEWRDTGSYWGKEDCSVLELGPEMHLLATGSKIVCFNSSIRGYPLGLSLGPDPREPLIRINETWNKIEFKKIPLELKRIVVFGAGEASLVEAQQKLRKARDDYAIARRAVDKKKLLEDYEVDREILSMGSAPSNFNSEQYRRTAAPE